MFKVALLLFFTLFLKTAYLKYISSLSDTSQELEVKKLAEHCENKRHHCGQEKSIVCYFTSWAWDRDGAAKYRPENINASLCTHINYAFASLDNTTLTIQPSDSWPDIDNKFYEMVTALRKQGTEVLISIGGWSNSGDKSWSRMLSDPNARANFVKSVVAFLQQHNFGGLDLDYEYPGCPQGDRSGGAPTDKANFNLMVKELKAAFNGKYLLTLAAAGGKSTIDECYDMRELCQLVDWINIMAYEYHAYYEGETGANSPMYGSGNSWGVDITIKYYLKVLQCPADKLVLGLPFYAQTYTMAQPSPAQFGVPVTGPGDAGIYTKNKGTLAYYETCLLLKSGWNHDFNSVNGSYAWRDNQFISLASQVDMIRKSCLINNCYNLRGGMFWTLDYDDFNNLCGCGSYPLLTTLNQQLRGLKTPRVPCY